MVKRNPARLCPRRDHHSHGLQRVGESLRHLQACYRLNEHHERHDPDDGDAQCCNHLEDPPIDCGPQHALSICQDEDVGQQHRRDDPIQHLGTAAAAIGIEMYWETPKICIAAPTPANSLTVRPALAMSKRDNAPNVLRPRTARG